MASHLLVMMFSFGLGVVSSWGAGGAAAGMEDENDEAQCAGCTTHFTITIETRSSDTNWRPQLSVLDYVVPSGINGESMATRQPGVCDCPPPEPPATARVCQAVDGCYIGGNFALVDPGDFEELRTRQGSQPWGAYFPVLPSNSYPFSYAGCGGGRIDSYEFVDWGFVYSDYMRVHFDMSCDGCAGTCEN